MAALVLVRVSWENGAVGNRGRGRGSVMAMDLVRELRLLAREALGHDGLLQVLVSQRRATVALLVVIVVVAAVEVSGAFVLVRSAML